MHWIVFVITIILTISIGVALIYAFYKIDHIRIDLENQIADVHNNIVRLVNAINAVNYTDFQLDTEQSKKIDDLAKKSTI